LLIPVFLLKAKSVSFYLTGPGHLPPGLWTGLAEAFAKATMVSCELLFHHPAGGPR
jgi:hypothetical protein